jgi:hypothetical protein
MLDQMRCDHQPRWQSGTPLVGVEIAEGVVEPPPINQPRKARQLAAQVDEVVDLGRVRYRFRRRRASR